MQYFVINECTYKGCVNWRINNKCIKDSVSIDVLVKFSKLLPDSRYCTLTRQLNN